MKLLVACLKVYTISLLSEHRSASLGCISWDFLNYMTVVRDSDINKETKSGPQPSHRVNKKKETNIFSVLASIIDSCFANSKPTKECSDNI